MSAPAEERIADLEKEIAELSNLLNSKKREFQQLQGNVDEKLTNTEISRYSRQLILKEIGPAGQLRLRKASVLIVGAGGLGCPAALYLCGAGVGHIGIIDYDVVEVGNLHRQIIHQESSVGLPKVASVQNLLRTLNSAMKVTTYQLQINSSNALDIIKEYDIVLDATDNVATRYLLNDACVLAKKPLVSGGALGFDGQLTVYNYRNGPCYRCLYPKPPPPETVTNCGDGGVIGAITGVIGSMQALEAIKIIVGMENVLNDRMLVFDGTTSTFRHPKLRPKVENCNVCGTFPTITQLIDYEQFCGMRASDKDFALKLLPQDRRISVEQYVKRMNEKHLLIDVRSEHEYQICRLYGSENVPIKTFTGMRENERQQLIQRIRSDKIGNVFVLCRRGNDSQIAAEWLHNALANEDAEVFDIVGGLHAWSDKIDADFPKY